jgi:hypothetical protein
MMHALSPGHGASADLFSLPLFNWLALHAKETRVILRELFEASSVSKLHQDRKKTSGMDIERKVRSSSRFSKTQLVRAVQAIMIQKLITTDKPLSVPVTSR